MNVTDEVSVTDEELIQETYFHLLYDIPLYKALVENLSFPFNTAIARNLDTRLSIIRSIASLRRVLEYKMTFLLYYLSRNNTLHNILNSKKTHLISKEFLEGKDDGTDFLCIAEELDLLIEELNTLEKHYGDYICEDKN